MQFLRASLKVGFQTKEIQTRSYFGLQR